MLKVCIFFAQIKKYLSFLPAPQYNIMYDAFDNIKIDIIKRLTTSREAMCVQTTITGLLF